LTETGHTKTPKALITEGLGVFCAPQTKKEALSLSLPKGVYAPKGPEAILKLRIEPSIKTLYSRYLLEKKFLKEETRELE